MKVLPKRAWQWRRRAPGVAVLIFDVYLGEDVVARATSNPESALLATLRRDGISGPVELVDGETGRLVAIVRDARLQVEEV